MNLKFCNFIISILKCVRIPARSIPIMPFLPTRSSQNLCPRNITVCMDQSSCSVFVLHVKVLFFSDVQHFSVYFPGPIYLCLLTQCPSDHSYSGALLYIVISKHVKVGPDKISSSSFDKTSYLSRKNII